MSEQVAFKGTKNGIILSYTAEMSFEQIFKEIEQKLKSANMFFKGAHIIGVDGPEFSTEQEQLLSRLIQNEGGMKVLSLEQVKKNIPKSKETTMPMSLEKNDNSISQNEQAKKSISVASLSEDKTIFHRGTLRSGSRLDSEGHLIVLGDANPGSELSAAGNIIVLGALRGFAQAGKYGDNESCIIALKLQPTQIRIGNWITRSPDGGHTGPNYPEVATVIDSRIVIEPYNKSGGY